MLHKGDSCWCIIKCEFFMQYSILQNLFSPWNFDFSEGQDDKELKLSGYHVTWDYMKYAEQ